MENFKEIISFLDEKRKLLEEFENATMQMLMCSSEELETFVKKRSSIIEKVDATDEKIENYLKDCDDAEQLKEILHDKFVGEIPQWAEEIHEELKNIKALLSRIGESDMQASARLLIEKEKILEQIKDANSKNSVKATRFYASSGEKREKNLSFGNA